MKISEVLHNAADHYLRYGTKDKRKYACVFSCAAVWEAVQQDEHPILKFSLIINRLREMGVNPESMDEFFEFRKRDKQGARYLWLKWAALMAEEQGE